MNSISKAIITIGIILIAVITLFIVITPEIPEPIIPNIPPIPEIGTPVGLEPQNISLSIGWNVVSMPYSINKYDVYITYNEESYTWYNASYNGLIADKLLFLEDNEWVEIDTFYKTKGYLLYSLVEPLYISTEAYVIYGSKLEYSPDGEDIVCHSVHLGNVYGDPIYFKSISWKSIEFFYLEDGYLDAPLD